MFSVVLRSQHSHQIISIERTVNDQPVHHCFIIDKAFETFQPLLVKIVFATLKIHLQ